MTEPGPTPPAGWYDDREVPGVRRYWDGHAWTDSRVTTEGTAYRVLPQQPPATRQGRRRLRVLIAATIAVVLVAGGAVAVIAIQSNPKRTAPLAAHPQALEPQPGDAAAVYDGKGGAVLGDPNVLAVP